jgi:histidinol-phosphate aminotransferase
VLVGNGSDEILGLVVRAFVEAGQRVVYPWPTYSLYPVLAAAAGAVSIAVPSGARFELPVEGLAEAAGRITFVANPNSPSGTWTALESIAALAGRLAALSGQLALPLVVDEAYADFRGESIAGRVLEFPNLLVVRTLSKSYALAGLRVGFLIGHPELVEKISRLKDSYNCGVLALAGAEAALRDRGWMEATVTRIRTDRDRLSRALESFGFSVLPSSANFVLARIGAGRAKRIYEALKARRILVRFFDKPGLDDAVRISIGTTGEVDRLVAALDEIRRES